MRTLKEDLNKMDSLTGEELDLFLTDMKAYYTSPEDKEAIRKHLLEELDSIKSEIADIGKAITIKEQLKDISEVVSLSYIAKKYFEAEMKFNILLADVNKIIGDAVKDVIQ